MTIELKIQLTDVGPHKPRITLARFVSANKLERIKEEFGTELRATLTTQDLVRVSVEFTIPPTLFPAKTRMPEFVQDLAPTPGGAGAPPGLREAGSNAGNLRKNPRFIHVQTLGQTGVSSLVHYRVDCMFLAMTQILRNFPGQRLAEFDGPLRPPDTQVRFYECTLGAPRVWAVGFAPARVPSEGRLNVLMYMMPTVQTYDDVSNVTFASLHRFLLSPSAQAPFFVRNDGGVQSADWPSTVTNCGFLDQLRQTQGPAVIAIPVPHFATHAPTQKPLRDVLASLRRALHADEFNANEEIRTPFATAVASFSAATEQAVDILNNNQRDIQEFYWFEPNRNGGVSRSNVVENWVRGSPQRRLRMVGTTRQADCRQIASRLPPAQVAVFPEPEFRRTPMYVAAVAIPPSAPAGRFPERLAPLSQRATLPQGHVSRDTGVFLEQETGTAANPAVVLGSETSGPATALCTPEEAAGKARFGMLNHRSIGPADPPGRRLGVPPPPNDLNNFVARFILGEIVSDRGSLHQWAVSGGMNGGAAVPSRDPATGFVGFLGLSMRGGALLG
jgi:hypothetical protein